MIDVRLDDDQPAVQGLTGGKEFQGLDRLDQLRLGVDENKRGVALSDQLEVLGQQGMQQCGLAFAGRGANPVVTEARLLWQGKADREALEIVGLQFRNVGNDIVELLERHDAFRPRPMQVGENGHRLHFRRQ